MEMFQKKISGISFWNKNLFCQLHNFGIAAIEALSANVNVASTRMLAVQILLIL